MTGKSLTIRLITVLVFVSQFILGATDLNSVGDVAVVLAQEAETPTEVVTEPSEETPVLTPTLEDGETPTPTASETPVTVAPTETPTETATPIPTETPTEAPTATSTPEPPLTPSSSAVPTPSSTPAATSTPTPMPTSGTGSAALTVPGMTLARYSGHVGETVQVSIAGFTGNVRVAIYFDSARRTTLVTDVKGNATGLIKLPAATAGLHSVRANGGGKTFTKSFRIRPVLTLSLTTVRAGYPVLVTLTGFAAGSGVKVRLYEISGSSTVLSVWSTTTDSVGGRAQSFTTKKTLTPGKHRVVATDAAGNSTAAYLTTTLYRPYPPEPDNPGVSQVYYQGSSGRREIALTFDADSNRGYAEDILDTLAVYGVKASFGVSGYWAAANPDLIRRMVNEGHQIINHSWSHPSFTGAVVSEEHVVLTRSARLAELNSLADLIRNLTGGYEVAPYFRPPFGDFDQSVLVDIASGGYSATVMWSCDTMGWAGASVLQIVAQCGYTANSGDIVLMHSGSDSLDGVALPQLIEVLQDRGFRLVTVEQLLQ